MDKREIVLVDVDGRLIGQLDVSPIDHANSQAPICLEIRTRCDMGEWHTTQRLELVPWGPRITK